MSDVGQSAGAGPQVCPFVALAEDRNRRADGPDQRNRCYAEPAPRQRDLSYQSDNCYSADFASCSVFLAWAARNAAEPAAVSEAARQAWASGIATPEDAAAADAPGSGVADAVAPVPTPEGGLFGPPDPSESGDSGPSASEAVDWVSAAAWADAPWDERAELEAEELAELEGEEAEEVPEADDEASKDGSEEATTGPKVPAALPMRRRRRPLRPIRTRGSGEWFYADPLDHEPLVRRRYGIGAPILFGVLALLVVALVIFLLPTLLSGGAEPQVAARPSNSPTASGPPRATRAPAVVVTAAPSVAPSPTPRLNPKFYRVKAGDSLSTIAERFGVKPLHLQCLNGIVNKNVVLLGVRYQIPPEGFSCWPGWKTGATPAPDHPAASVVNGG